MANFKVVRKSDGKVLLSVNGETITLNNINGKSLNLTEGMYAGGNISASSFTDRTPFYEGDAIADVLKIKGDNGEIDHSTLPDFTRVQIDGEEGRDIGAMVSILTVAVQELVKIVNAQ